MLCLSSIGVMIAHQWRCKHEVIENASSLKNPLIGLPRFPRNHAGERTTVALAGRCTAKNAMTPDAMAHAARK